MELSVEQEKAFLALIKEGNHVGLRKTLLTEQKSSGRSITVIIKDQDEEGMTVFLNACEYGHLNILSESLSLEEKEEEHRQDFCGRCDRNLRIGLQLAARDGHLTVVNRLVELGVSVKDDGAASIHLASNSGHLNVVGFLPALPW